MPSLAIAERIASARALARENPGAFCHAGLFWSFWLSLALFPIGYGFREVMPLVGLCFLLGYYRYGWRESVLANLPVRWLFGCFFAMVFIGIAFSANPWASLLHAGTGVNKGFLVPFLGMECVRDERDLRRLVWAAVIACFWEGLDGIWQRCTGRDFIMGYGVPWDGRLSGSFADYGVGNYIALALVPAFGLWQMLRRKWPRPVCLAACAALLGPAFFLLQGAAARSGFLAVAFAVGAWFLLSRKRPPWWALIPPLAAMLIFFLLQPERLSIAQFTGDGRWSLWRICWQVFRQHPWLGAGAGQYNAAFRSLGLVPTEDSITISHPHNMYLDMLYAHGIIGFTAGMVFLFGFLFWAYRIIRPRLLAERAAGNGSVFWRLAGWFWLGYAAWLVNGIFGHNFYRIWWLGLAMSYLGVVIGAAMRGAGPHRGLAGQRQTTA